MTEEIHGVIENCMGNIGRNINLFFTSNRVIVAKTGNTFAWQYAFGAVGGIIEKKAIQKRSEEMKKLSVESILTADKKNFDIPYIEVNKVEMKKPGMLSGGIIKIFTNTKKYQFVLQNKKSYENYLNLMTSLFNVKLTEL